jgi:hypothetical protein
LDLNFKKRIAVKKEKEQRERKWKNEKNETVKDKVKEEK